MKTLEMFFVIAIAALGTHYLFGVPVVQSIILGFLTLIVALLVLIKENQ